MDLPKPEDEDVASTAHNDGLLAADRTDSVTAMSKITELVDGERGRSDARHTYLAAPQVRRLRPASPSTLSILSAEELDELNPRGMSTTHHAMNAGSKMPAESSEPGKFQRFWTKHKGVTWALLAQCFGAMMNMAAQELEVRGNNGEGLNAFEILFVRMGITVFFSVLYMWHQQTPHFPFGPREVRWLLVGRALGGFVGVWAMYFSLRYLPVQLAVVITFLAPFLTNFVCSKIYGEPFTRTDVVTGLVSLVGVILLAHPETLIASLMGKGSNEDDVPPASGSGDMAPGGNGSDGRMNSTPAEQAMAVGVALLGVLGSAVAYTTIRVIGKRAHPLISVNYFGSCCLIISSVVLIVQRGVTLPADLRDWGLLIFLGVCGFTMQFLLAKGLAHEKSAKATNMQFSQMFFAMLGDKLIFGYTPDLKALLGSGLIISGVICMILQKAPDAKSQQREEDAVTGDEEARTGLLAEPRDVETAEDHDRIVTHDDETQSPKRHAGYSAV